MPLTHRTERIAELLREEISQILATEVADPGVGLVTVSRVKVTPDLSLARVYWTMLGDVAERKKTIKALQRAAPFVRHVLAGRVTLRRVPEVAFQFDEGLAAHARIEEILHELHEEEAVRSGLATDPATASDAPAADRPGPDLPPVAGPAGADAQAAEAPAAKPATQTDDPDAAS